MKLTLVENAVDSIGHGLAHYVSTGGNDYKYAILHLVQAIELLFKERLRREHEAFLYSNIDELKGHRTVSLEQALKRLINLCKIPISEKEINIIHSLSQLRNQIEHYEFDISEETARAIMAKALAEIIAFCSNHLDLDIREKIEKGHWQALLSITEFMPAHARKVMQALSKNKVVCEACPVCAFDGFERLSETKAICHVCGFKSELLKCDRCGQSVDRASTRFFEAVDPGEDLRLELCFSCAEILVRGDPTCLPRFLHG